MGGGFRCPGRSSTRSAMNIYKTKLQATLLAVIVLSSLGTGFKAISKINHQGQPKVQQASEANSTVAGTGSSRTVTHSSSKSGGGAIAIVNPPNPGPYKN